MMSVMPFFEPFDNTGLEGSETARAMGSGVGDAAEGR